MKKTLLFVCLFSICNLTMLAQTGNRPRSGQIAEKSAIHTPPPEISKTLTKIYSNLGSKKTDLYDDSDYWYVNGSNGLIFPQQLGLPFTPKSNSHISQVQVAIQYQGLGANQVNISIYGDAGGVPGTLLAGPVTVKNLPAAGTCCGLAVANFTPVAVTGGSHYWIVASAPSSGAGSDFVGGWNWSVNPQFVAGIDAGGGWSTFNTDSRPAGEVLGSIP